MNRAHRKPRQARKPNAITLKTFQDTDAGRMVVRCDDRREMFDKLGLRMAKKLAVVHPGEVLLEDFVSRWA